MNLFKGKRKIYRATLYQQSIVDDSDDVILLQLQFSSEPKAKAFKKATELAKSRPIVKIEPILLPDSEGLI